MSDYLERMAAAVIKYETAQATWHAVTAAYQQPGRAAHIAERKAATDQRRIQAEALQAFWSNEAVMYALAAIATGTRP